METIHRRKRRTQYSRSSGHKIRVYIREIRVYPALMKSPSQFSHAKISRRSFLANASVVATAVTIAPRAVFGGPGQSSPNRKLNVGVIGAGGRGADDLEELKSENIVALC